MLTFDPVVHRYQWNGITVPSVTQILAPLSDFSMVAPDVLEFARQRGVAVHACVQLDINNDLDDASVAPEIAGYLGAWRAFRRDCQLSDADFGDVEQPRFHQIYRYAGTPDMAVCMDGAWSVLDIKTANELSPVWALQTAAYRELINVNTPKGQHHVKNRYSLRLREDGKYKLDEFTDRNDFNTFLAMLTVHRWRETNLKGA